MPMDCEVPASAKPFLLCIPLLFLWLCWCNLAHAQVRLGLETQVEYNDNIFLEEADETRDWIYRVAPWIALARQWPRFLAELRYQPRYTWYDRNPEYDLEGHNVALDFSGSPTRTFSMGLNSSFVRAEERSLDRFNPEETSRRPYSSYASTLSGTWATGIDESFGFSLFGETLDFDKESSSIDSTEVGGELSGRQRVGDLSFVTLNGRYVEGDYDDSTSYRLTRGLLGAEYAYRSKKRLFARLGGSQITGDARENYTTLNPLLGVAGELKNVQYDVGAGVLIYDQEGDDTTYAPSLVANVTATRGWRRGEVTASFASGYDEEYLDSGNPGFDTYASGMLSARYAMTQDWTCDGSGELRGDYYQDNRPGESDRNEATLRLAGGLEHRLMRRATLRLDYMYNARRSEINRYEYDENSIVLTLNIFSVSEDSAADEN